jgi:RecA/RadA recombinase
MSKAKKQDNYFSDMVDIAENPYASVVEEGIFSDVKSYIDTGNYVLNAQLSGSLFKGIPQNKIVVFAGDPQTGKTYLLLGIIKNFLDNNLNGGVIYFESEGALTTEMIISRGIDPKRMFILPVDHLEEFKTQALRIIKKQLEIPEEERRPMMMCLDSLGMLSSKKELEDTESGKDVSDMTKSKLVKAAVRVLTLPCSKANVPFLIANHVYEIIGAWKPTKTMGGGKGPMFAASIVVYLAKSKMRDESDKKDVIGTTLTSTLQKGRFTKEFTKCEIDLIFASGLKRYSGLLELGLKYGLITKDGKLYVLPGGEKVTKQKLESEPEKYYTQEVLKALEPAANAAFAFGTGLPSDEVILNEEILDDD